MPRKQMRLACVAALLSLCSRSGASTPDACAPDTDDAIEDECSMVSMLQLSMDTELKNFKASEEISEKDRDVYAYLETLIEAEQEKEKHAVLLSEAGGRKRNAVRAEPDNTTSGSAAELSGVTSNASGDWSAFLVALGIYGGLTFVCFLLIGCVRPTFPLVYQHKTRLAEMDLGSAEQESTRLPQAQLIRPRIQEELPTTFFGWMTASYRLRIDDIVAQAGLDHGMLIEFTHLALRITLAVGLPAVCILAPLHIWCGGNAAGDDYLSWQGINNVQTGSWIYWVHPFAVWYVVLVVEFLCFRAMRNFMPRRAEYLHQLPEPQANTILVEDIPWEEPDSLKLRQFFDKKVFGYAAVKEVYIVKDTTALVALGRQLDDVNLKLERMDFEGKAGFWYNGSNSADLIAQKRELMERIEKMKFDVDADDSLNSTTAFVSFNCKREALLCQKMFSEDDEEEIVVRIPPHPNDIIWKDLICDDNKEALLYWIGCALIVALFFGFLPVVIAINSLAQSQNLVKVFPFLQGFFESQPSVATAWDGLAGSLVLAQMMAILPTILLCIYWRCFINRAETWLQLRLQQVYFWFLIVFVLLVTAISSSILGALQDLADDPVKFVLEVAGEMALSSHFYLNYLPVEWLTHAMCLTRYTILIKYIVLSSIYGARRAHELCEPEDQDFQGMGARSARFSLTLSIMLTYCTLSPLITILGCVTFGLCRLIYGYLFVYAETTKAGDLGGEFFVQQLRHTHRILYIYVLLMSGILATRAASYGPAGIAICSLGIIYLAGVRFQRTFRWEFIDFKDVDEKEGAEFDRALPMRLTYKQPELPTPKEFDKDGAGGGPTTQCTDPGIQKALQDVSQRLRGQ